MKVILTAFQRKLISLPMEFPDETPPTIHLVMDMEQFKFSDRGNKAVSDTTIMKRGTFERTGNWIDYGHKREGYEYILIDIS